MQDKTSMTIALALTPSQCLAPWSTISTTQHKVANDTNIAAILNRRGCSSRAGRCRGCLAATLLLAAPRAAARAAALQAPQPAALQSRCGYLAWMDTLIAVRGAKTQHSDRHGDNASGGGTSAFDWCAEGVPTAAVLQRRKGRCGAHVQSRRHSRRAQSTRHLKC
jgi:hypothetical protein